MGIVIVLLATLLMSAMGAALVLASATEVTIAAHFQRAHEVRHAAAGAFEVAVVELRALSDWNGVLAGAVRSARSVGPPTGVRIVAGQPIYLDQLRSLLDCLQLTPCSDAAVAAITVARPWGANNPRWRLFRYGPWSAMVHTSSPLYTVVMVADDTTERDGDPSRDALAGAPGAGRIRVRAEAFGATGAHAAVEAFLERNGQNPTEMRILAWHFVAAGSS